MKCNKPSDAIRSKSLSRFNQSPKRLQQLSFDWSGTCSNPIEFQIFLAPSITKQFKKGKSEKGSKAIGSKNNEIFFDQKPENQGDVWYFTRVNCQAIKKLILMNQSDQPKVQLKAASLNLYSDDVKPKNAYREIVKSGKDSDRRGKDSNTRSGNNQLTVMNLNDGSRFLQREK